MRGIAPAVGAAILLLGACTHPPEHHYNRTRGATAGEMFGDLGVARLAQAACAGDAGHVIEAVRNGVDPNSISVGLDEFDGHVTPLLWAIDCGNARGIDALLRVGADPNQSTGGRDGLTPVLAAADSRNPAVLRLLLQNGGDPNAISQVGGYTALRAAFDLGLGTESWENWNALLDAGANIDTAFYGGHGTIATYAATINRFDKVVELLEHGYSYELTFLGFTLQRGTEQPGMREPQFPVPPLTAEAEAARQRAIAILVQRGVRFPISREDVGIRDPAVPASN
ncbi:MAG: ankyrin repeat domain-containing protein [Terricaulis sp.]